MRLPCDAALLVIDVQRAIDDPRWGARNNPDAEGVIAGLLQAWRAEGLPIVHVRHDSTEPDSPYRPDSPGHPFKSAALPLADETVVGKSANSAFIGTRLEETLDELGATTLVVCGALTNNSVEATVRHGGNLGYRIFVVADACWAADKRDLAGRLWPAADVHALSLANLQGAYAQVVDSAAALQAAAAAKGWRRWRAARDAATGKPG
jgi:nicotinamidase-related amidase